MKARMGFVSNSSSSSFVVLGIGFKEKGEVDALAKSLGCPEGVDGRDFFDHSMSGLEYLYVEEDDGTYGILGKVYADVTDNGNPLETQRITISQIIEIANSIANQLGVDVNRVQFYMGTRPS